MSSLASDVRRRLRWVIPQVLALGLVAYFGYHLIQGDRGLRTYLRMQDELNDVRVTAELLRANVAYEQARVDALSAASLDPDLLEERAQTVAGFLRPEERVILLPASRNGN